MKYQYHKYDILSIVTQQFFPYKLFKNYVK